jgi:hypothetical protein
LNTKVVNFPKAKSPKAPKTDAELVADIKKAHRALCRAIDVANAAGLRVELKIDAEDQYGEFGAQRRVRRQEPRVIRVLT